MLQSRQLAAIMFTDIAGYTAVMGENEQKAFEILRQNRNLQKPLIEQHHGKWIKELGDGVLASFSTVTDAVNCACAILRGCKEIEGLHLRIGIHLGEIVVEDDDVFGDGVNIASRIQAVAAIDSIWVSEAVHSNVVNKKGIETRFVKEETLKHVKEPVRIYQILAGNDLRQQVSAVAKVTKEGKIKSLAILPFADLSAGKDQEYLGDGIAEELLNLMSQVNGLKVIGRTSSFSFKNKDLDLKTIGKLLNENTILEGSVQKAGNRVRITSQLINAQDGFHIWSQRYDREIDDIFALQDDICSKIAEHLKLTLLQKKKRTKNLKAYEWFLKADYYWKRYGEENIERAIACCRQALELDPEYADAWWLLGGVIMKSTVGFIFKKIILIQLFIVPTKLSPSIKRMLTLTLCWLLSTSIIITIGILLCRK